MSTLSKQLAAIAAKSTHQLDLKAQRAAHGKSLLFDPRIAISQDFETLYQICYEAWEELCLLDHRFMIYGNSLFNDQSKTLDRGQMTATQNEELDLVIQSFLGLVTSRLLLKPAQKGVEWLIRRFQVHENNTEQLLLAFLPYHSTPLFISLMSLLTAERIPQTFRFLLPYHSSLTNPPTHAVLYSAAHNFAFFAAFNHQMLRICRESAHSPAIVSFWSSISSQAIDTMLTEAQSGISSVRVEKLEAVLLRILPVINDALAIKHVNEVTVCACLLITVLAAKGHLSDNIIQTLMEAVISSWSPATADARLVCLSVLAQNSQLKKLPKSVSKKVLAVPDLLDRLRIISDAYDIDPLLVALIHRSLEKFIKYGDDQTLILIKGVLDPNFSSKQVRYSVVKKLTSESASFLNSEGEYTAQERENTRQNLAALFQVLSVSQANSLVASVAQKKGLDLAKLGAVLGMPILESSEDLMEEITYKTAESMIQESKPLSSFIISESTKNDNTQFLEHYVSPSFTELSNIFCAISSSSSDIKDFIQFPELQNSKVKTDDPTLVSFLIRICSSNLPIRPRTIALDNVTEIISNATKGNTDYHVLTPYLVRMLADPNVNIRRSASKCLLAISKPLEGSVLPQTWAKTSFYADPSGTVALSSSDAKSLFKTVLLPRLEECVLDQSVIVKTLKTALSKHSSDQSGLTSLSSSTKASIINFLATHSTKTKLLPVRLTLFSVLASVGKAGSEIRSTIVLPTILEWSKLSIDTVEQTCQNQGFDLSIVNQSHFQCITARDESTASSFGDIIQDKAYRLDAVASAYSRLEQLWQTIEKQPRLELLSRIFTLATSHDVEQISVQQAQKSLRSLHLLTDDLDLLINNLPKAVKMPEGPVAKRRRVSKTESLKFEAAPQVTLDALRAYTLVLEVVDQSTPSQHPNLLKSLFDILAELQSFALQTNTNLEYLKYLTVNSLLQIVDNFKATDMDKIDKNSIRTGLLVDTIRGTSNSQLQNSALLLVSCLAAWRPDDVLHSVMPIFTFMGSNILRQGDDYSAHVIEQTVSRVVPPIVSSLKKKSKDVVSGVADLLLSFTAAFEHIPPHRRLVLFERVVNALGPEECLSAVIVMIVDRISTDRSTNQFVLDLMGFYDSNTNLKALQQCVELILDMFSSRRSRSEALMHLKDKPLDDLYVKAHNLMEAISNVLSSTSLRNKFVQSLKGDDNTVQRQQAAFAALMGSSIRLTQQMKNTQCRNASRTLLSNTLIVLPMVELVESAKLLMDDDNVEIQEVVISSIGNQGKTIKSNDSSAVSALLSFMSHLTDLVSKGEQDSLLYSMISCINNISARFGKKDVSKVLAAAKTVLTHGLTSKNDKVQIISLEALASMSRILKEEMIALIPKVLSRCYEIFSQNIKQDPSNSLLSTACLNLLTEICENLPFIMSGDNLDTALQLVQQSISTLNTTDLELQDKFYDKLAHNIDAVELFSALDRNFGQIRATQEFLPLSYYLKLVKLAIEANSKTVVIKNAQPLFNLISKAFELRMLSHCNPNSVQITATDAEELETTSMDVAISMVLKINDAVLRPFFIRLVEQTTFTGQDQTEATFRSITLFQFLRALIFRLKALVTGYISYVLEPVSAILSQGAQEEYGGILLRVALNVLSQCFEYDEDDFWQSPAHFNSVVEPLLFQLEDQADGIAESHVIPAITMLALASTSADHFKAINAKLLKMMGADSISIKLVAVKCQQSLTNELGEDWLVLLPEMLPFIAELLEDDHERVEKETRSWIRLIEEILGESLDSMLQ